MDSAKISEIAEQMRAKITQMHDASDAEDKQTLEFCMAGLVVLEAFLVSIVQIAENTGQIAAFLEQIDLNTRGHA